MDKIVLNYSILISNLEIIISCQKTFNFSGKKIPK